jgi:hypothetical protein
MTTITGFILFCKDRRDVIYRENVDFKTRDINRKLNGIWNVVKDTNIGQKYEKDAKLIMKELEMWGRVECERPANECERPEGIEGKR